MCGNGKESMIAAIFGSLRSTHIQILPDFYVTTLGDTHAEALMCSIIPAACKRFTSSDTALRTESGRWQTF